jgi:hypothetical protein
MKKLKDNKAVVNITRTYFDEGKIIFPQTQIDYELLPKIACSVKVIKGNNLDDFFDAKIVFTTNGSARINDIRIKSWFEEEKLRIGDTFSVEIIDKTTYRIYK